MSADVLVRRARPEDYTGVLAIGDDIHGGRDILPFMYSRYITDPDKMCFVMLKQGEVVAFVVLRNFDGGTSYEAVGTRTKHTMRGKLLMMYMGEEIKKQITISRFITASHKQRYVAMDVESTLRKQDMIVHGYRTTVQLSWKATIPGMKDSINMIKKLNTNASAGPLFQLNSDQLRTIFQDRKTFDHLSLPQSIFIVENQTYQLGYMENANLILQHGLTDVYATKSNDTITSLSFGTAIPCGNTMVTLRVGIEYYGPENLNTMLQHIQKHFTDIPEGLTKYPSVKDISVHFFMPKSVCTKCILDALKELVGKLKLNAWQLNDQAYGLVDHTEEVRVRADEVRRQRAKKYKSSL